MDADYGISGLWRDDGFAWVDQDEDLAESDPDESAESTPNVEIPRLGGRQRVSFSLLPAALTRVLDIPNEDAELVDFLGMINPEASATLLETSFGLRSALLKLRKLGILPNGPLPTFWRALLPRAVPLGLPPLIDRLPTELLSTIFIFLVEAELATKSHTSVRLSHVCSTWRATALGEAALWTHVNVRECDGQWQCARRRVAELYTQRAQMLPLDVAFDAPFGIPRQGPDVCPCTLDLVLTNMPRTRSLSLFWTHEYALRPLSRVPPADKERLESLSVTLDDFTAAHRANTDLVARFAASAPVLRELYWRERALPAGIPYARMTALALGRCPLSEEDVLWILRYAPALTQLNVNLFAARSFSHAPLTHRALQSFRLAGEGTRNGLFSALSFPALRYLWVGTSEQASRALWPDRDAEVWLAFLGRMVRGLESLDLSEVLMEEETLLRSLMLPQLAGLRNLSVQGDTLIAGYDLFQLLRPNPAGSIAPALPNLQKLTLSLCEVRDGVVGRILQSRFEYGMPMSWVVITFLGTYAEHSKDSAMFRQLSASRATNMVYAPQVLTPDEEFCKFILVVNTHNRSGIRRSEINELLRSSDFNSLQLENASKAEGSMRINAIVVHNDIVVH
ncbi:uncharacterized protein SCHCODRAFT_02570438 [Schizophyllum commune H4-8]|nr:uncharacterized protein SCHCODRAFT_02570438 [Schizophyllum commune H4-8]KAI5897040.1 hypothetical protein SCHCODRAFT_02570438 [Schizophyllum commune H4-8]